MAVIYPSGVKAQGNIKLQYAPTVDLAAPSLAGFTAAGTTLDLSGFLTAGGWSPGQNANRGSAPRRLVDTKVYETFGTTTETLGDLVYVVDPQAAAGEDGKKAYELLTEGTTGYIVERLGIDAETDFAVGDWVIVKPVIFGPQQITGDPSDEFAEFTVTQPVAVRSPGSGELVQVVA